MLKSWLAQRKGWGYADWAIQANHLGCLGAELHLMRDLVTTSSISPFHNLRLKILHSTATYVSLGAQLLSL
jgi:hypothetical protein